METYDSVVDLIGNTPLVRLHKVTGGSGAPIYAKVEYFNPGGSVKDRIALRMVDAAERDGLLKPGGTLLYATCSIFKEENSTVIGRFLDQTPDAVHQDRDTPWGEASSYGKQLLPSSGGSDGLYYALLQKTAS